MGNPDILLAIRPVIKVQGDSLDREYLIHWSDVLGVADLLRQAFRESGIPL